MFLVGVIILRAAFVRYVRTSQTSSPNLFSSTRPRTNIQCLKCLWWWDPAQHQWKNSLEFLESSAHQARKTRSNFSNHNIGRSCRPAPMSIQLCLSLSLWLYAIDVEYENTKMVKHHSWSEQIRGGFFHVGTGDFRETCDRVRRRSYRLIKLGAAGSRWHQIISPDAISMKSYGGRNGYVTEILLCIALGRPGHVAAHSKSSLREMLRCPSKCGVAFYIRFVLGL